MGRIETKVRGPYLDKRRNKWRVWIEADGERCVERFDAKGEAQARIDELQAANPLAPRRGVIAAIGDYEVFLRETRQLRRGTVTTIESAVRQFWGERGDMTTREITVATLRERVNARLARGRAVDTVASELRNTKAWIKWLAQRGWAASSLVSQLDDVRVEGRRNKGKKQLTLDESRRFVDKALQHTPEVAAAVVAPLLLSVDGHEILDRTVRDVDDNGKVLVVPDGKTINRRRRVEIPEVLRPLFAALVKGKGADDPLFPASRPRRGVGPLCRRSLSWALKWTHRICDAAKVPRVCPHGLRGTHATLAESAGVSSHIVAATLGHADDRVTGEHYTARGTREAARQRRLLRVIAGDGGQKVVKAG